MTAPKTKFTVNPHEEAYSGEQERSPLTQNPAANNLVNLHGDSDDARSKVAQRKRKKSKHPLREFRIKRGYTLEELAELTRLSPSYLSRLESGTRRLNADVLHRLAMVLSCHPGDLLIHDSQTGRYFSQSVGLSEQPSLGTLPQDLPLYELTTEGHKHQLNFDQTTEWLPRPPELIGVAGSFAFKVGDETLGQRYRKEDHVFTHPNKALSAGCSILVITRSDQALVGQFLLWKGENSNAADTLVIRLTEKIGNEDCTKDISLSRTNIKSTYRIIGLMEAA